MEKSKPNELAILGGTPSFNKKLHYRNYSEYQQHLACIPGIFSMSYDEEEQCNYQYIILEVDESVTKISRNLLIDILWAENVIAQRYFFLGCHCMEPYRSLFPEAGKRLPLTEFLAKRLLSLPTGSAVSIDDIKTICHIILFASTNTKEISGSFS
jgi:dTDP-4-amino-4,6-dideoxygalactose transaminase